MLLLILSVCHVSLAQSVYFKNEYKDPFFVLPKENYANGWSQLNSSSVGFSLSYGYSESYNENYLKYSNLKYLSLFRYNGSSKVVDKPMSDNINNMKNLEFLNINNAPINKLPNSLNGLTNLKYLILGTKCDNVPRIGNCSKLEYISIVSQAENIKNAETDLSKDLSMLSEVHVLKLTGGKLGVSTFESLTMPKLEALVLRKQNISDISFVTSFSQLHKLIISESNVESIPKSIDKLNRLEELYLTNNKIEQLPEELFNLTQLKKLDLGYNNIASISSSIKSLTSLEVCSLLYNSNLTDLPKEILLLPNLKFLDLMKTSISKIPETIVDSNIERIVLSYTKINGENFDYELIARAKNLKTISFHVRDDKLFDKKIKKLRKLRPDMIILN